MTGGVRMRAVLAAVLLLLCAVTLVGRSGSPAPLDCSVTCPVESIVSAPDDIPLPCLRDPACGGGFTAAFVLLAVVGYRLRLGPAPLAAVRRARPARTHSRSGFVDPPSRPPAG